MKNNKRDASTAEQADLAMKKVLQAEREAEQAVMRCEQETDKMLKAAKQQAQHIAARTNARISRLQGRFEQKLSRSVSLIEQAGQTSEQALAGEQPDQNRLARIIEALTAELTTSAHGQTGTEPDA